MVEILLIIALVIAVCFDIIRILQYIQLRKLQSVEYKIKYMNKLNRLYEEWIENDRHGHTLGMYVLEHWDD